MKSKDHSLLIRKGTVVTPELVLEQADVLVQGEQIQAIGYNLPAPEGCDVYDAQGLIVLPGVIDAHTHIQLDTGIYKTADTWVQGSRTAIYGGVTTVVDFATQFKGQSLSEALMARLEEAAPAAIDYALHMMVTDIPAGREDELAELVELGVTSIKLYTTYRPNYYSDDATLYRLLEAAGFYGIISLVHCENDALVTAQTQALVDAGQRGLRYHGTARPALAEQEATARVLFLAEAARAPVVIAHNSTARTVELVNAAREAGQVAFSETAPQYLLLDETLYEGAEPWRYILQPPLRNPLETGRLWDLVAAGGVDMLITDHCDYPKAQKTAQDDFTQTPGGLPGLETLLPLMATYGVAEGRISWGMLARLLSTNPAQIYGLWPRKGGLIPGADADIVLYDPEPEDIITASTQHTVGGYTPYEGMRVKGRVVATIRRGEFLLREGTCHLKRGSGQFIPRAPVYWQ